LQNAKIDATLSMKAIASELLPLSGVIWWKSWSELSLFGGERVFGLPFRCHSASVLSFLYSVRLPESRGCSGGLLLLLLRPDALHH
jgi:hypothetical protein